MGCMKLLLVILLAFISFTSIAQVDSSFITQLKSLDTANTLRMDTTAVPYDKLTQKIRLLRGERGGFNIEMAIRMKLQEEQAKDKKHSKAYYDQLLTEVTTGKTSKLIDNVLVNLYRRSFTEEEIDQLVVFYKTSAGKKMNKEFILLMVRSIKDAEHLVKLAAANMEPKKQKAPPRHNPKLP